MTANQNDRAELAFLWKEAFHDSDEFVNLFFDRVYKPENTLVARRDSQIVSALQMIPYKVKVNDLTVYAAYVCGVCTRESEKGRGYMSRLMSEALQVMKERNFAFSFLIPANDWLFDVYRKMGYKTEIQEQKKELTPILHPSKTPNPYPLTPIASLVMPNAYRLTPNAYFHKKQSERECCVLHDCEDFDVLLQDNRADGGDVFVALCNGFPVGIIFAVPLNSETVLVPEILYDAENVGDTLIRHVAEHFNAKTVRHIRPRGLACVLDENLPEIKNLYMTLMLN